MAGHLDGRKEPPRGLSKASLFVRRWLSGALPVFLALLTLVVVIAAYYFGYVELPRLVVGEPAGATEAERTKLTNEARTAAVQALGGLVLAFGAGLTVRSLRLTREGQITDRFAKAVEHLGDEKVNVRIAAIHALGRIARDSPADRPAIFAILGDHLRLFCPSKPEQKKPEGATDKPTRAPHPEIHAAALVLRSRKTSRLLDEASLDFSAIDWQGAPLSGAELRGADFSEADLSSAFLDGADLRGTNFFRANLMQTGLRRTDFRDAYLVGVRFDGATAPKVDLRGSCCTNATFKNAETTGAKTKGAIDLKLVEQVPRSPKWSRLLARARRRSGEPDA